MADSPYSFIFSPTGEGGVPTYGELEQRRKIAAALAGRKRPYPTTIGEGIASFGESIGESLYDRQTRQLERESGEYTNKLVTGAAQPTTIQPAPYRGGDDEPYVPPKPPPAQPAQAAPPAAAPQQPPPFPAPLPGQGASMAPATGLAGLASLGSATAQPDARQAATNALMGQRSPSETTQDDQLNTLARPQGGARPIQTAMRDTGTTTDAGQIPPMGGAAGGPTQQPPPPAPQQQVAQAAPPPLWATSPTTQAPIVPPPPPLPAPQQPPATAATAGIGKAPEYVPPPVPPARARPTDPNLLPMVNPRIQQWNTIATDRRIDPAVREQFQQRIKDEQEQIKAHNALQMQGHTAAMTDWRAADTKRRDYGEVLGNEQKLLQLQEQHRKLVGEGFFPIPPEKLATMPPFPEGVMGYQDRWGNLKTIAGPARTTATATMGAGETQEAKSRGEFAAKRSNALMERGERAGSNAIALNRAEALLEQIDTGALEQGKMTMGAFGRAIGIPDQMLADLNFKPEQIGNKQNFLSVVNELTIGKLGTGGFPTQQFSNTDRDFLSLIGPALGDSKEANYLKIKAAKMIAQRDMQKVEAWADFKNDPANEKKSFDDFEFGWNKEARKQDLSGELLQQARDLIAANKAQYGTRPAEQKTEEPRPQQPTVSTDDRAGLMKWLQENPNDPKRAQALEKLKRLEQRQ